MVFLLIASSGKFEEATDEERQARNTLRDLRMQNASALTIREAETRVEKCKVEVALLEAKMELREVITEEGKARAQRKVDEMQQSFNEALSTFLAASKTANKAAEAALMQGIFKNIISFSNKILAKKKSSTPN